MRRERRLWRGHAAPALDGGHQRRFLAAHERAGPFHDFQAEGLARAEEVVAEEPGGLGVGHGLAHALDCQGILGAHVDVALVRADAAGGDHHALDDAVRVALHDGAVHERARVAFVAVADDVFLGVVLDAGGLPFAAGGKTAAAAAAQARFGNDVAHGLAVHFGEGLARGRVAAVGHVFLDLVGVDEAAFLEHAAVLALVEGNLVRAEALFPGTRIDVEQALHGFAPQQGEVHDVRDILLADFRIENVFGQDGDQRPHLAKALAAAVGDAHAVAVAFGLEFQNDVEAGGGHLFFQGGEHLLGAVGHAAGAGADDHPAQIRMRGGRGGGGGILNGTFHYCNSLARMPSMRDTARCGVIWP